jgi:hypothetical protein
MIHHLSIVRKLALFFVVFILVTFSNACKKNLTIRKSVYNETFEDGIPNGISALTGSGDTYGRMVRPFNGTNVLGMFNNTLVSIAVDSLPVHNMIYVELDFYAHDAWEGNKVSPNGIVDVWNIQVNGGLQLSTTFSNTPENKQSYPDWIGSAIAAPPRSNSMDTLVNGFCANDNKKNGSSKYHIVFSRAHTENSLLLQFNDALQGAPCYKSWSIDNIHIETITN